MLLTEGQGGNSLVVQYWCSHCHRPRFDLGRGTKILPTPLVKNPQNKPNATNNHNARDNMDSGNVSVLGNSRYGTCANKTVSSQMDSTYFMEKDNIMLVMLSN